ncbi:MAG TPA: AMP-binding protein [Acidimicrobiales bacterium]|nr:AMP-binding protein [Acidimicrobiales bacterium]
MNLASIIDPHPDDAPALLCGDRVIAYGELRRLVAGLRSALVEAGVSPDDRVVLALPNDWPFVVAYLAVLGVGAVAVPVDPSLPPPALSAELAAVEPVAAVVGEAAAAALADVDPAAKPAVVMRAPDGLTELAEGRPAPVVDRRPEDLALLVFTAGTAGPPKAAMLTHGNLLANLEQVQRHPGRALVPADVGYGVLPLFHVFGINVVLGLALFAGSSVLLVERFDPAEALGDIPRRRVSLLAGAPPLFAALAAYEPATGDELQGVRLAVSGAAALPPEVGEAFTDRFGIPLWQGYGLTEAAPVVTSSVIAGVPKPGSIGVPVPGVEVRLVDEGGEDALVGDRGELWVRGPNVFPGYWRDPTSTAAVLTPDGWLRTGDIAVADDDGYLYLVDRAKDLIIVSGFNVYPAEVEDALRAHPGVADVAVVGAPDPRTGEMVEAFVVAAAGTPPTVEELRRFCSERLAGYKCPGRVTFVEALARGVGGKLIRRAVRPG